MKLATEFRRRAEAWIYSGRVQRQRVSRSASEKHSVCLLEGLAIFGHLSSAICSKKPTLFYTFTESCIVVVASRKTVSTYSNELATLGRRAARARSTSTIQAR